MSITSKKQISMGIKD